MRKGFSLIEVMVASAIAAVLMTVVFQNFTGLMRTYRRDGAIQQLTGDVRKARAEAIRTGWQYRLVGYSAGSASAYGNQYRLMGRSSTAAGWPADTVAAFQGTTQTAGTWTNVGALFKDVRINPSGNSTFSVAFDSRGVRIEVDAGFSPAVVSGSNVASKSVSVSVVGSVRIQ